MARTQTINFNDFMKGNIPKKKVDTKKIAKVATIAGLTAVTYTCGFDIVSASSGIDATARGLYNKLLLVGKWIIIVKGGIDTVSSVVQGDVLSARKNFMSYLVVYFILHGIPWAMDQVDTVFKEM